MEYFKLCVGNKEIGKLRQFVGKTTFENGRRICKWQHFFRSRRNTNKEVRR